MRHRDSAFLPDYLADVKITFDLGAFYLVLQFLRPVARYDPFFTCHVKDNIFGVRIYPHICYAVYSLWPERRSSKNIIIQLEFQNREFLWTFPLSIQPVMVAGRAQIFRTPDYRMSSLDNITLLPQRVVLPFDEAGESWSKRKRELAPPVYAEAGSPRALLDLFCPELRDIFRAFFLELFYILACRAEKLECADLTLVFVLQPFHGSKDWLASGVKSLRKQRVMLLHSLESCIRIGPRERIGVADVPVAVHIGYYHRSEEFLALRRVCLEQLCFFPFRLPFFVKCGELDACHDRISD